jgi:hypothetical protein
LVIKFIPLTRAVFAHGAIVMVTKKSKNVKRSQNTVNSLAINIAALKNNYQNILQDTMYKLNPGGKIKKEHKEICHLIGCVLVRLNNVATDTLVKTPTVGRGIEDWLISLEKIYLDENMKVQKNR